MTHVLIRQSSRRLDLVNDGIGETGADGVRMEAIGELTTAR
jgi:hypothetical protein